jgi:hypothetical protein
MGNIRIYNLQSLSCFKVDHTRSPKPSVWASIFLKRTHLKIPFGIFLVQNGPYKVLEVNDVSPNIWWYLSYIYILYLCWQRSECWVHHPLSNHTGCATLDVCLRAKYIMTRGGCWLRFTMNQTDWSIFHCSWVLISKLQLGTHLNIWVCVFWLPLSGCPKGSMCMHFSPSLSYFPCCLSHDFPSFTACTLWRLG